MYCTLEMRSVAIWRVSKRARAWEVADLQSDVISRSSVAQPDIALFGRA
jgi:hypothetical protein